jgi:flagellar biosynthesis regulator FlbT
MSDIGLNIFEITVEFMKIASTFKGMTGEEKKYFVMEKIRAHLGEESYNRYELLFSVMIDGIMDIAKDKNILAELKKINKCCCINK